MSEVSNIELEAVTGGASSFSIGMVVTAIVIFVSGIISGITDPRGCGE